MDVESPAEPPLHTHTESTWLIVSHQGTNDITLLHLRSLQAFYPQTWPPLPSFPESRRPFARRDRII